MTIRREHSWVGVILLRMTRGLFAVYQRNFGPELLGTVTTPIPHVERDDLAGSGVHRDPNPLLVRLFLPTTPQLIRFGFQASKHHICWTLWESDRSVIRTRRTALHDNVQELCQTDAPGAADSMEREAFAQHVFNQGTVLVCHAMIFGCRHTLSLARLTWMLLLAMAGMAIVLGPIRSTCWARVSDDHGCC
jgi:hypothetical protein